MRKVEGDLTNRKGWNKKKFEDAGLEDQVDEATSKGISAARKR